MLNWQDMLGQCALILMTLLPILLQRRFFLTNINAHIKFCRGFPYLNPKDIMITWINKNS